jgi:Retrotransposon gag protein
MSDPAVLLLVQQLQQELQNQRTEIQLLRSDLDASRADVYQLQLQIQTRLTPAPTAPTARPRLPDPPRFDGKPLTLRTWLPSIKAKLRSDQLAGADAFDYVWDRLEQSQQASVLHLRQSAEDTQSWDPENIFSFFQRLCHNPREQQEAIQRFSSVRQREEESLIAYLTRFKQFAYEANASSWPDVSRVMALHRGLRPALRQSLEESSDSLFSLSYSGYVELVQRLDRRSRRPPVQKPDQKPAQKSAAAHEPMDVDHQIQTASLVPAPQSRNQSRARPSFCSRPPSAASSRSRSRSSSAERRSHRMKNGFCLCCGARDHWIAQCPHSHSNS